MLTGARQTGKTTLARSRYEDLAYLSLDAPENREMLRSVATPRWGRDVGNAILDEAQKEPSLFDKVKYAFDQGQVTFTLLLGSSQILLLRKIRESLAGRVSVLELWPLMMGELARETTEPPPAAPLLERLLSGDALEEILGRLPSMLAAEKDAALRDAEDYLLRWGGMPAILNLGDKERKLWLRDYQYTYLERDLADLARLSDLDPFHKFQRLSALRSGRLLSYSQLARDAGVSVDTARRYLEYLRLSYQAFLLQPYHRSLTSTVIKTPKIYWVDVGLMRQLAGRWDEAPGVVAGEVFETMVMGEILKWLRTTRTDAGFYFYRTRSGLEMDGLLETQRGIVGLEARASGRTGRSDARAMRDVARAIGEKWLGGVVAYRGNRIEKLADPGIWAVPSRRLFT